MGILLWNFKAARALCIAVEQVAKANHCHVALTGGCLYSFGDRKDCDILFYRVRQCPSIDIEQLLKDLEEIGIKEVSRHGWVIKARTPNGLDIDLFFPEHDDESEYPTKE